MEAPWDRGNREVIHIYYLDRGNTKVMWIYYVNLHTKCTKVFEPITIDIWGMAVFNYMCFKNYSNYVVTMILKLSQ